MNKTILMMILFLCFTTFVWCEEGEEIDKLFQKANEAEFEAQSKEDFEKVIELYKKIVMDFGDHPNRELLASCIFSIAQIYSREFKLTDQPQGLYEMILEYYPDTSWAGRARDALGTLGVQTKKVDNVPAKDTVSNPFGNIGGFGVKGAKKVSGRVVSSFLTRDAKNMKDDILSVIGKKIRVSTKKVLDKQ